MLTKPPVPYDLCVADPISCWETVGSTPVQQSVVGTFNQEKALVGAFSVIVRLHRLIVCSTNKTPSHFSPCKPRLWWPACTMAASYWGKWNPFSMSSWKTFSDENNQNKSVQKKCYFEEKSFDEVSACTINCRRVKFTGVCWDLRLDIVDNITYRWEQPGLLTSSAIVSADTKLKSEKWQTVKHLWCWMQIVRRLAETKKWRAWDVRNLMGVIKTVR